MFNLAVPPITEDDQITGSPTTGQTVNCNSNSRNQIVNLTPLITLLALNINFPPNQTSRIGQRFVFSSTQSIGVLTFDQVGGTGIVLGFNAGTATADAGAWSLTYIKTAPNTYLQVGNMGSFSV